MRKHRNGRKNPNPETPIYQRLTYYGRFYHNTNLRGRTCRTKNIPDLPYSHMPVRLIHRRREIYLPHVLDRKYQSHEPPIQMAPTTNASSKGLGKLVRRSSFYLQYLNITWTTGPPKPGSTTISIHLIRVDLLTITGHSPSPQP